MQSWHYILIGLAIVAVGWFLIRRSQKAAAVKKMQPIIDAQKRFDDIVLSLKVETKEPGLPTVKSRSPLTVNQNAAIRAAFSDTNARAAAKGWAETLDPERCRILIFPAVRQNPAAFQVFFPAGTAYDESEFDQEPGKPGGWTYAVEQVLTAVDAQWNVVPDPSNTFIIAEVDNFDEVFESTRNGLQHLLAYKHDLGFYLRSRDHVPSMFNGGDPLSHPIF